MTEKKEKTVEFNIPQVPVPEPETKIADQKLSHEEDGHEENEDEDNRKKCQSGHSLSNFFTRFGSYLSGMFTPPLVKDPIYFALPASEGARIASTQCHYHEATEELIDGVFEERKEKIKGRDGLHWINEINLDKYPGWDETTVELLRDEFRFFDRTSSGVITFQDVCDALDKIGNKATVGNRRIHFEVVDTDKSGFIDFHEFCGMVYNLSNAKGEAVPEILYDLYKSVDRDMTSIRTLSVVQQLQAGLF